MSKHSKTSEANQKALEAIEETKNHYRALFRTDLGKLVLKDMKKSLRYGKTLFHEGQPNTDLHFHLGRQSVINDIEALLSQDVK